MIFPPAFLDSSSCWNTNHNQLQQISPSAAAAAAGGNNLNHEGLTTAAGTLQGGGGGGDGGGGAKPMSMSERARLARVPQPEPGLNCPRCDSTNTKFCYFNNYSLTQPRHFCRACRRYWTRGGALRNVPVGGGYRRHAKRSAKSHKASASSSAAAAAGTTSSASTTTTPSTGTAAAAPPGLQSMFSNNSAPSHGRFADFDPASLGLSFPARLLFADAADGGGAYAGGGTVHHHQGSGNGMEQQWASQMQSFPFLHAMDHQMGPPPAAMPTTMVAMQGMFHLGLQSGGEDGGDQFHVTPAKRDQQDYTSRPGGGGIYGDVNNGGYTFYSSSNAAGN